MGSGLALVQRGSDTSRGQFAEFVIPQLLSWRESGLGAALVTLIGVDGSSPRPIGSQLAVNEHGETLGAISQGCVEASIVVHAMDCIRSASVAIERYGSGSRFFDVRLACGSAIDIHIDPIVPVSELRALTSAISKRRSISLHLHRNDASSTIRRFRGASRPHVFECRYQPPVRVVIVGRGFVVEYLAEVASRLDFDVVVASPDRHTLECVSNTAGLTVHLADPASFQTNLIDSRTALVLLFHDHDWEADLLKECQHCPAFYVGALGSSIVHQRRKELLRAAACRSEFIESIHGPVGLPIGARNPPEIAISIISEILAKRRTLDQREVP